MGPGVTVIPRIPVAYLPSVYLCLTVLTEGNIQADSLLSLIDIIFLLSVYFDRNETVLFTTRPVITLARPSKKSALKHAMVTF